MVGEKAGVTRKLPTVQELQCFRRSLLRWYSGHGRAFPWRRASASSYEKIIAEVLLQRTRAETVAEFLPKFTKKFPSWRKLGTASLSQLESCLKPIGLWRRRAISIHALARDMVVRRGRFPRDRETIEKLPGVGQYIANAILLYCHDLPEPLIDVNMARVLERVFGPRKLADIRYDKYLQQLARDVVRCRRAKEVNWAVLDLAALVCLGRNPRCDICPLAGLCLYKAKQDDFLRISTLAAPPNGST